MGFLFLCLRKRLPRFACDHVPHTVACRPQPFFPDDSDSEKNSNPSPPLDEVCQSSIAAQGCSLRRLGKEVFDKKTSTRLPQPGHVSAKEEEVKSA